MRALRRLVPPLAAALVLASVAACSSGSAATVKVSDPWARSSSAMAAAGAAYLTIENTGSAADALTRVASPVATTVEIHETVAMPGATPADGMGAGGPMPSASGDAGPMLGMQPVARLEIPAGGTVELKPGSYHIMLIGLTRELNAGDTIELTLTFEKAGDVKVSAEVRAG